VAVTDSARIRASSSGVGGFAFTPPPASMRLSSASLTGPVAVSIVVTACPRVRNASAMRSPDASDTSRSEEVPPINTVIFTRDSW
jgi:hypothetical protein